MLEATRRYLLLVANRSLDADLRQKVAPSDLVQETFLNAHRDFGRFKGESEAELYAWLCRILSHKAADAGRMYRGTAKRNIAAEQPLENNSGIPALQVPGLEPTPSALAVNKEHGQHLTAALQNLPTNYRQVIELRSLERLPFAEVGRRMGRSAEAAGKLWFRALQQLREELASLDASGFPYPR